MQCTNFYNRPADGEKLSGKSTRNCGQVAQTVLVLSKRSRLRQVFVCRRGDVTPSCKWQEWDPEIEKSMGKAVGDGLIIEPCVDKYKAVSAKVTQSVNGFGGIGPAGCRS